MDANRFDSVAKFLADRRLSRRQAMVDGGVGLAAGALAVTGLARTVAAQDATPVSAGDATPAPEVGGSSTGPAMLYVQTFQAGSIAPKEGVEGRYTLSLESGIGQTIYFSDRPDRIAGAAPTGHFLANLGFPDDNPPNAALVVETAPGETDVAVVELFSPVYDEATQGLTYEIEVLGNWESSLEMGFSEAPTDLAAIEPSFGSTHLFIDGLFDCPDHDMVCYTDPSRHPGNSQIGVIPNADHDGFCVSRPSALCYPCKSPDGGGTWQDECNRRFSECNGTCIVWPTCTSPVATCGGWGV